MEVNYKNALETAFLRLSEFWRDEFGRLSGGPPKYETDLKALAAMLIAVECPQCLSSTCFEHIRRCNELSQQRISSWDDTLPWMIADDAFNNVLNTGAGIHVLINNLNHGKSDLRLWTMEIAWVIRKWLHVDEALPKLFDNVASTIFHAGNAWGLASSLFSDTKDFYQAAEQYKPEDNLQDQYQERLRLFKENDPLYWQAYFWKVEAECRRCIQEAICGSKQVILDLK